MKVYNAFISYSHANEKTAARLHRYLERYRVPRNLEVTADMPVPRRLFPIFRDREELPTASDLGTQINSALEHSEYLIVICSPESARSRWVNEEILTFKRMGKENRILALIIDGEPHASGMPDVPNDQECFPEGLKYRIGEDGNPDLSVSTEPIAADFRKNCDGPRDSFLKIASGLLSVGFDELKRRDFRKRQRIALGVASLSLAVLLGMGILAGIAVKNTGIAEAQRDVARQQLYTASVLQARTQWDLSEYEKARRALWFAPAEYRNWEWGFLARELYPELLTLEQPESIITGLSLNSDGSVLLAHTQGNAPRLWNMDTGNEILSVNIRYSRELHKGRIEKIYHLGKSELSPDGLRIAMSYDDGLVNIIDTGSGKILNAWNAESGSYPVMDFSPDSNKILLSDIGTYLEIRDVESGGVQDRISYTSEFSMAHFFAAGTRIVSVTENGKAQIWDAENGTLLYEFGMESEEIVSFTISPNENFLSTASDDATLRIWSLQQGTLVQTLSWTEKSLSSPKLPDLSPGSFNHDGTLILKKSTDNTLRLWSVTGGNVLFMLGGPDEEELQNPQFSPDGRRFLVSYADHIEIRDTHSHETIHRLDGFVSTFPQASYSTDGSRVLVEDYEVIRVFDAAEDEVFEISDSDHRIRDLCFNTDGELIAAADSDTNLLFWNMSSEEIRGLLVSNKMTRDVRLFPDGSRILIALRDGAIGIWDVSSAELVCGYTGHQEEITNVPISLWNLHISPNGDKVMTRSGNSREIVHVWDSTTGDLIYMLDNPDDTDNEPWIDHIVFSPRGSYIYIESYRGYGFLYDSLTGELIARKGNVLLPSEEKRIEDIVFSPDESELAIAYLFDEDVHIQDVDSGIVTRKLKGAGQGYKRLRYSPEGKYLAVISDGDLYLWERKTGELIGSLEGHTEVRDMVFNPRGDRLLIKSSEVYSDTYLDSSLVLWDVPTGQEVMEFPEAESVFSAGIFNLKGTTIATAYSGNDSIRIWETDPWRTDDFPDVSGRFKNPEEESRAGFIEWKRQQYVLWMDEDKR